MERSSILFFIAIVLFSGMTANCTASRAALRINDKNNGQTVKLPQNHTDGEQVELKAGSEGSVKVIIKFHVPQINELTAESTGGGSQADTALMNAIADAAQGILQKLKGTAYEVHQIYKSIPYMALQVSMDGLAILRNSPEVLSIEEDKPTNLIAPVIDNGQTKNLLRKNILEISLKGNPTTGDAWEVSSIDPTLVKQIGEAEFIPDSQARGSGGVIILRLQTVGKGTTPLKILYPNAFEKNIAPNGIFEVSISIH